MGILAGALTAYVSMSILLWMTDTVVLWAIGFIGFAIFLPPAVSAWIAHFLEKAREAQGKPKGNTAAIFAIVTGICLVVTVVLGAISFNGYDSKWVGYGFLTAFVASPVIFFEFVGTLIAAIVKSKAQSQTQTINYGMYINPPYNDAPYNDMQGGMPYNNAPYNNPNGYYPPDYQNGGYPNGNFQNGNYQNNNYRQ